MRKEPYTQPTKECRLTHPTESNIDRYLAVWQAANPGSWTDPNTGKLKKGLESLTEELKPFFKNEQGGKEYKYKFWTSEDVADTEVLGYKYPDIQRDPEETKRLFEEKYGWSTQLDKELENRTPSPPDDMKPLDLSNAQVFARHPEYLKPVAPAGATTSRIAPREIQMQRKSTNNPRTVVERSNPPKDTASHDGVTAEEPKNKIREWFVDDVVER